MTVTNVRVTQGRVLLTGVQAVCRVPVDVRRLDARRGLNTRAFVSGYQGSPLGTIDFAFRPMAPLLDELGVDFRPGMNESLAATAVQGTQSIADIGSPLAGVTGYWYGKAPGVDQALDPIRHGNLMGTHPDGGVLALVGDDASAKSSTVPSSSEVVLRSVLVPVLTPADPQDVLDLGLHGIAMSRATGLWTALKVATSVADGSGLVRTDTNALDPVLPLLDGRPYRHAVMTQPVAQRAVELERSIHEVRLPLALEYARLNWLNRITLSAPHDRFGIVAAGKIYLEVRQALHDLGLDDDALARLGIRLLKIGMPWPLDPEIVREFGNGLDTVVVVEEKGPFLELLVRDALYDLAARPQMPGTTADGRPLFPRSGEVSADAIARSLGPLLLAHAGDVPSVRARLRLLDQPSRTSLTLARRAPYFCSGCPHNSSTKTPEGALVGAGIGCHGMASMMEPSQVGTVVGLTQMGGEGAQWIGQAPYTTTQHLFQNIGDGTLAHSGLLAIRGAVAAGVSITYKVLFNSAVAMTGGQDAQGGYGVPQLCRTLEAEGVRKIIVTTDEPRRYRRVRLPRSASVRPRDQLIAAQEELSALPGVTVLIHDQECAAELRRKRKRKLAPDPVIRAVINERICEGCGDCGRKSNCLSVIPVDTLFGRKTQIDQSTCNKDYSCFDGDCPSFMEVTTRSGRSPERAPVSPLTDAPWPVDLPQISDGFTVRITGIGGTGIVTVSHVLASAAVIDGLTPVGLDQIGLSQKAGPVVSDLRFATGKAELSNRIGVASCDLYLGCDVMVAADATNLAVAHPDRTIAVVSTADVPTGAMIRRPETALPDRSAMTATIDASTKPAGNVYLDARSLAQQLFGDDQLANMVLLGAAFQAGALPLAARSIEQAIELNGVAVPANLQAFRRGRQLVADPAGLAAAVAQPSRDKPAVTGLAALVTNRVQDLTGYQNAAYARRYAELVARVQDAEGELVPGSDAMTTAVARNLYTLMAYKDEYEVARLALDPVERAKITAQFGPDAKVRWKLHPPILKALGMKRKVSLGRWFTPVLVVLSSLKWLRGTKLDPFGYARVRRTERRLIEDYRGAIEEILARLSVDNHELAVEIADLPDTVRGYEEVKLKNVAIFDARVSALLDSLRS